MKDNLCTTPADPWANSVGCGRRRTHHQRLELTHMKDNLCTTPADPWANSAGCSRRRTLHPHEGQPVYNTCSHMYTAVPAATVRKSLTLSQIPRLICKLVSVWQHVNLSVDEMNLHDAGTLSKQLNNTPPPPSIFMHFIVYIQHKDRDRVLGGGGGRGKKDKNLDSNPCLLL